MKTPPPLSVTHPARPEIPKACSTGKRVSGVKPHILVDTEGLLMHAVVHPADIQDRDGGLLVLSSMFGLFPFVEKLFADGGYQGPRYRQALAQVLPELSAEIVKRSDTSKGSRSYPGVGQHCQRFRARERVEWQGRVLSGPSAWLNRCRRLAKDFENLHRNDVAFIKLASIRLMLRKLSNIK
jgi:transposase